MGGGWTRGGRGRCPSQTCEGAWKGVELGAVAHKLPGPGHVPLHGVATHVGTATIWHDLTYTQECHAWEDVLTNMWLL